MFPASTAKVFSRIPVCERFWLVGIELELGLRIEASRKAVVEPRLNQA